MFKRCSMEEFELCAIVARGIWTRRNVAVHRDDFEHPNVIVRKASENLNQFRLVQMFGRKNKDSTRAKVEEKWTNPPSGRHKANWDIAIDPK